MLISLLINLVLCASIYLFFSNVGSEEAFFWTLLVCLSLLLLSLVSPGKNLFKLPGNTLLKKWHILAIAAWSIYAAFPGSGSYLEKTVRSFCCFIFFTSGMEFFWKILRPDIEKIKKRLG